MAIIEAGHSASRAVDDLYRRHGGEVYRYALAVLGNHADAEDVTQTTFLNAYRSIEQGVRPRKPSNWLLTIASNAIKQRFRQEHARPRQVELDDQLADVSGDDDDDGPTIGELLTALSRIPPQQRQAIVLREFEGRSYGEIADILGVTTSALETLLFRARRSLAEELEHHLSCTEAQLAVSQAADGRLGRKARRRLREHLGECPDCAGFARLQHRHRRALRGLMLIPVPVSLSLFKGLEGSAAAATLPVAGAGAAAGAGSGVATATGGGLFAGGVALKAAAVVTAVGVAGGVGAVAVTDVGHKKGGNAPVRSDERGLRLGQVAPRGVTVPGRGVARGKANAPGQKKADGTPAVGRGFQKSRQVRSTGRSEQAKANAPGETVRTTTSPRGSSKTDDDTSASSGRAEKPSSEPSPKRKATTGSKSESNGQRAASTKS